LSETDASHKDANALLNAAMTYARELLRKEGEFSPFGVTLDVHDRLEIEASRDGGDDAQLLDTLRQALLEKAGRSELRAAAMAVNVEARAQVEGGFQDAVRVEIEHQGGYCAVIVVPYRLSGGGLGGLLPRKVEFGKTMSRPEKNWLWPPQTSDSGESFQGSDVGLKIGPAGESE
jgi:hypothetical protein